MKVPLDADLSKLLLDCWSLTPDTSSFEAACYTKDISIARLMRLQAIVATVLLATVSPVCPVGSPGCSAPGAPQGSYSSLRFQNTNPAFGGIR